MPVLSHTSEVPDPEFLQEKDIEEWIKDSNYSLFWDETKLFVYTGGVFDSEEDPALWYELNESAPLKRIENRFFSNLVSLPLESTLFFRDSNEEEPWFARSDNKGICYLYLCDPDTLDDLLESQRYQDRQIKGFSRLKKCPTFSEFYLVKNGRVTENAGQLPPLPSMTTHSEKIPQERRNTLLPPTKEPDFHVAYDSDPVRRRFSYVKDQIDLGHLDRGLDALRELLTGRFSQDFESLLQVERDYMRNFRYGTLMFLEKIFRDHPETRGYWRRTFTPQARQRVTDIDRYHMEESEAIVALEESLPLFLHTDVEQKVVKRILGFYVEGGQYDSALRVIYIIERFGSTPKNDPWWAKVKEIIEQRLVWVEGRQEDKIFYTEKDFQWSSKLNVKLVDLENIRVRIGEDFGSQKKEFFIDAIAIATQIVKEKRLAWFLSDPVPTPLGWACILGVQATNEREIEYYVVHWKIGGSEFQWATFLGASEHYRFGSILANIGSHLYVLTQNGAIAIFSPALGDGKPLVVHNLFESRVYPSLLNRQIDYRYYLGRASALIKNETSRILYNKDYIILNPQDSPLIFILNPLDLSEIKAVDNTHLSLESDEALWKQVVQNKFDVSDTPDYTPELWEADIDVNNYFQKTYVERATILPPSKKSDEEYLNTILEGFPIFLSTIEDLKAIERQNERLLHLLKGAISARNHLAIIEGMSDWGERVDRYFLIGYRRLLNYVDQNSSLRLSGELLLLNGKLSLSIVRTYVMLTHASLGSAILGPKTEEQLDRLKGWIEILDARLNGFDWDIRAALEEINAESKKLENNYLRRDLPEKPVLKTDTVVNPMSDVKLADRQKWDTRFEWDVKERLFFFTFMTPREFEGVFKFNGEIHSQSFQKLRLGSWFGNYNNRGFEIESFEIGTDPDGIMKLLFFRANGENLGHNYVLEGYVYAETNGIPFLWSEEEFLVVGLIKDLNTGNIVGEFTMSSTED